MSFINFDKIKDLSEKEIRVLYKKYYNNSLYNLLNVTHLNKVFVKAKGMYVYDNKKIKYLDFLAGFGALPLGHNEDAIYKSIYRFKSKPNLLDININVLNAVLANNLSNLTNNELSKCIFTNCGTETVEEALKIAMMLKEDGYIIYFNGAYHGKTLGSISLMGSKIKDNYNGGKLNALEAEFFNFEDIEELFQKYNIAAVIIEPIQGEGGINLANKEYFKELKRLCENNHSLLIFDEIQTGIGRCGYMFYYEALGVIPDCVCLSKGLSGGVIPVGAVLMKEEIWDKTHGKIKNATLSSTTFGGNSVAMVAAIKTLDIILEKKLCENAKKQGDYLVKELKKLKKKHNIISDVRGEGLLIGVELGNIKKLPYDKLKKIAIGAIIEKMLNDHHIICSITSNNPAVIRVEPPLIVTKSQCKTFIKALDSVLSDEDSLLKLTAHGFKNLMSKNKYN
ncbi:putrescine aminotransferase [Clostridium cavendishii DSM 21758]|uniref:Putrescine aminotransferase n=1 Tax=Clostridium cavendishii DSM 21758 TaxID=1121302 RepID=A0A1M6AJN1_9CLOT|nr:aspartate aminotransferase family protein [Clostridium cavendishii]SHI36538.1 putrescine aminotransferase [Clostridium cavendishii DSM 21758]